MLPYGFGLSYTTFTVDKPAFSADGENVRAVCRVKNTGDREGAQVVQMYVGFGNSSIDRPVKLLRGFQQCDTLSGRRETD